MDVAASVLMGFPPEETYLADNEMYDREMKSHIGKLNMLLKKDSSLLKQGAPALIKLLNPETNSISYLILLDKLVVEADGERGLLPLDELLDLVVVFLTTFDPRQIRYAGSLLMSLLEKVTSGNLLPPLIAVQATTTALLRIDPTGSMLTSIHCALARLAYRTECIDPILALIERPIVFYTGMTGVYQTKLLSDMNSMPPNYLPALFSADLKPANVLEYDLLCGLIWCSKRNWAKAYDAFERVISYPTKDNGVSKIMVEVYKKWLLVGLLLHGQVPSEPSYTGGMAKKVYSVMARPYQTIANFFVAADVVQLKADAEANANIWREDNNLGLVQEVLASFQKWQIINLQDVYSKISISEIRQLTESAETGVSLETDTEVEILISDMIKSGMLHGEVTRPTDGKPPYLTFLPDEEELSEAGLAKNLAESARRIKALGAMFKVTHERLSMHKDHIRHLAKEQKKPEKEGEGRERHTFESHVEDEDLMTGVASHL